MYLLTPTFLVAQVVSGKLYDSKTTAKNVQIINIQKNIQAYSTDTGSFEIAASIGDSLVFKSLFYVEKTVVLTDDHFTDTIVIQLKKVVNKLDEVVLAEKPKFIPFEEKKYQANFNKQLEKDRKNRPYLYHTYRKGGVDFIAIANLIGKLFKRNLPDPIHYVTYKELDVFFNTDTYFNGKLLHEELKISEAYRFLFFDYCEARKITKKQLQGNQLVLLNILVNYSNDFHKIIDEQVKE